MLLKKNHYGKETYGLEESVLIIHLYKTSFKIYEEFLRLVNKGRQKSNRKTQKKTFLQTMY